jgi:membrane fusion protein, multidrug efflux system
MDFGGKMFGNKSMIVVVVALIALFGVWEVYHNNTAHANQTPAAAPAVPVSVITIQEKPIRTWSEFSGRMEAVDYAEIRPEVSGRVTEIKFEDGQTVQAGDVLFVIDPRTYKAAVAKAQADLDSARTNAVLAKLQFDRAHGLMASQAIAQEIYDQRANAYRAAQAALEGAQAQLDSAKVDLDRAYVKAPISGRVSRAEITVGNLVNAGPTAPILTSIVSNDGIYADFEVDEQTYLQSIRRHNLHLEQERQIPVELTLDGDNRVYKGTIYSFDNKIDTSSGTIRARAKFANEDGVLIPGMFVSVKLASSYGFNGILIPERAVSSDQSKKFVYVVDKDNKVVYRELELGQQVEGQRIVIGGLKPGEKVIVDGLQHVRPDSLVTPQDISSDNSPSIPPESTQ